MKNLPILFIFDLDLTIMVFLKISIIINMNFLGLLTKIANIRK